MSYAVAKINKAKTEFSIGGIERISLMGLDELKMYKFK